MEALSIGRDQSCDIVINDSTDIISRRHATLNISPSGKITIVDQSRNGTYVNGIRISQNVPVPISRKDLISFAHVAKLDWNAVPKSNSVMRYAIMGILSAIVLVCGLFAYQYIADMHPNDKKGEVAITDSIKVKKPEEKNDSANTNKELNKQQKDSINAPKQQKGKALDKKTQEDKEKSKPAAPKDSVKNNRPIG